MQLSELYHYPLKSCAPRALKDADVGPMGLPHDRHWMLARPDGEFITARDWPRLVLVTLTPTATGFEAEAPDMPVLVVDNRELGVSQPTEVWSDAFPAWRGNAQADRWFSEFLGTECILLYIGQETARHQPRFGVPLSFADGYPLLLIGDGALADLNGRLAQPVSMRRFRPNLVVSDVPPFEEDYWKTVRIGEAEFDVVKPCARCIFTTVDPETGEKHPDGEPLSTLAGYRNQPEWGVTFGQNLIVTKPGRIRVGDEVEVLEWSF